MSEACFTGDFRKKPIQSFSGINRSVRNFSFSYLIYPYNLFKILIVNLLFLNLVTT